MGPEDTWAFIYTSGTTGRPKGAMRSHGGLALHNLATWRTSSSAGATRACWSCRCATPTRCSSPPPSPSAGASCCVYDAKSFEPEQLLRTLADERATFTSLVPTHYIMMLALPDAVRAGYDVDSVRGC